MIDPEIKGRDRELIAEVMAELPAEERENVVYIDASHPERTYSNRAALNGQPTELWTQLEDNMYQNQFGATRAFPVFPDPVDCEPGKGTGSFFRVHSVVGSDYRLLSRSTAVLDLTKSEIQYGATEGLYLMLGGWGAPITGGGRVVVDAGLMFNRPENDWSVFLKIGPAGIEATSGRFIPASTLRIRFSVPRDNYVRIEGFGTMKNGEKGAVVIDSAGLCQGNQAHCELEAKGWRADGIGNLLKQETGLAQNPPENLVSGAYVKNINWTDVKLGHGSSWVDWANQSGITSNECFHPFKKIQIDGAQGDQFSVPYADYRVSINLCQADSCF